MKLFLLILTSILLTFMITGNVSAPKGNLLKVPGYDSISYDSLRAVLESMYDTDQGIRRKTDSAKGDELGRLVGQLLQIDASNQVQVRLILDQYGWLPQSKVGEKAADALFYVVQHASIDIMKKYFPALKQRALEQEAKMTNAALMEDRILMYEGKKQIYGTQATSRLRADGKGVIWPIQNPKQVNRLRKEAGFELTVEENAKRLGAFYNPDEKLPKTNQ